MGKMFLKKSSKNPIKAYPKKAIKIIIKLYVNSILPNKLIINSVINVENININPPKVGVPFFDSCLSSKYILSVCEAFNFLSFGIKKNPITSANIKLINIPRKHLINKSILSPINHMKKTVRLFLTV